MKISLKVIGAAGVLWLGILTGQAASPALTFNVSDSDIQIGDTFTIDILAKENASAGDLTGFGFDIDPGNTLTHLMFNGYTIGGDYTDLGSGQNVVGAYNGTGNAGASVELADLSFTALSNGADVLDVIGLFDGAFLGAYYENADEDIIGHLTIVVGRNTRGLPDAGSTLLLMTGGSLALAAFRRKLA